VLRVEVTNFESIDHAVVEIEGFTTVQGPNYSGKSAMMRAIHAALTNPAGTGCISWGKKFCEVRLQSEGLDLLWHKEDGNNFYRVNGETYEKIGRDDPPAKVGELGYGAVRINGERHNLHFADQFNPLFLVDEQSTRNSDLIASAYGLDRIYKAADLCSRDQRSAESLLKVRRKDLAFVTQDLEKFGCLDAVIEEAANLKARSSVITKQETSITQVRQWLSSMVMVSADCARLKPALSVSVPNSEGLSKDSASCGAANGLLSRLEVCTLGVQRLEPIKNVTIPMPSNLSEIYMGMLQLFGRYERAEREVASLKAIEQVGVAAVDDLSVISKSIDGLVWLRKALSDMLSLKEEADVLQRETQECLKEFASVEEEKSAYGSCPLGGSKL